jgi:hypothetical protein
MTSGEPMVVVVRLACNAARTLDRTYRDVPAGLVEEPTICAAGWLKLGIGLALSAGLFWLAARQVDLAQLGQSVGQAHPAYLVAAISRSPSLIPPRAN